MQKLVQLIEPGGCFWQGTSGAQKKGLLLPWLFRAEYRTGYATAAIIKTAIIT